MKTFFSKCDINVKVIVVVVCSGAGGDLQKLLDDQVTFREDVARSLLLQVLSGLRFLHSHSIAHLDIKVTFLISLHCLVSISCFFSVKKEQKNAWNYSPSFMISS